MVGRTSIEERLRVIGAPKGDTDGSTMLKKWNDHLKKFSNYMEEDYKENRETSKEFNKKIEILKEIEGYLATEVLNKPIRGVQYEMKAVVPFGSSASGLGMKGGDLDMIVCVHPPIRKRDKEITHSRSNDILKVIFQHITEKKMLKDREVEDMEHYDTARVPIITGYIDDVEIDISISMTYMVSAQYLSSKFIDAYEKYNRDFIILAAFVKKWQKSMKTEENEDYHRRVFPNSCSLVLLVIFFMKYYGLLPDIHKDKLEESAITWKMVKQGENGSFGTPKTEILKWKSQVKVEVNLGTLFLLFLDFYSNVVDFKLEKVNIARGCTFTKGKKLRNRIVIEDVIDKDNPAKSVLEPEKFQELMRSAIRIVKDSESGKLLKKELLSFELVEPPMTKERRRQLILWGLLPKNS